MSVELVNGCVLMPDRCDWSVNPKWSRRWPGDVQEAAAGGQDRSLIAAKPKQRFECSVFTPTVPERNRLIARVLAAYKNGNAALPNWGRPAYTTAALSGGDATVDTAPPLITGDYVLIVRPWTVMANRVLQINCGGAATAPYTADAFYDGGGVLGVGNAINRSLVADPAPEGVYQYGREIITVNTPSVLTYTLAGFNPAVQCLVRLHFCEIDPDMAGTYHRKMDITVSGSDATSWTDYEIYTAAGNALYKATVLEAFCTPDPNGVIKVQITGVNPHIIGIPSVFYYPALINAIEVHQIVYAARQLTAVEEGALHWSERLRSLFPKESLIVPLILGRFGLSGPIAQLTDYAARVPGLICEEPKGSGSVAVTGACPNPITLTFPYDSDPGSGVLPGTHYASKYVWGLAADINPNEGLMYDQIGWHITTIQNEYPGPSNGFFWQWVPTSGTHLIANDKWAYPSTNPGSTNGDRNVLFSAGYWQLIIVTP